MNQKLNNTGNFENKLRIVIQALYGNRTITYIDREELDYIILGILDGNSRSLADKKIDRTIIKIPDTENLVLIYNKYQEAERSDSKPLVFIPQENIIIKSRCAVCRMDKNNNLLSLTDEDYNKVAKYLAE